MGKSHSRKYEQKTQFPLQCSGHRVPYAPKRPRRLDKKKKAHTHMSEQETGGREGHRLRVFEESVEGDVLV
jgi:hypothetical protein